MNFSDVFFYSSLAGISTLFGTWLVLRNEQWSLRNSLGLISFASGVMLTLSFVHLIPDAAGMYPNALFMVFGGFLSFYMLQQVVMIHVCHEEHCHVHRMGLLSAIGLTIHSLLDGVAIAAGFEAAWSLGILTTLAVLLHEIPEGIIITGILLHARMKRKRVIVYSVIVALATPLGAMIAYFFLRNITPQFLGMLLALTAGSFIYIAAADLLPETHKTNNRSNAFFFFLGILVIGALGNLLH